MSRRSASQAIPTAGGTSPSLSSHVGSPPSGPTIPAILLSPLVAPLSQQALPTVENLTRTHIVELLTANLSNVGEFQACSVKVRKLLSVLKLFPAHCNNIRTRLNLGCRRFG